MRSTTQDIDRLIREGDAQDPRYASTLIDALLASSEQVGASDVHLQPTGEGLEIRWRIDGVLQPVGQIASEARSNVVARLKVLADLLTYRTDVPQEGRIRVGTGDVEMRVSTFPTLHGERAVVRLFGPDGSQLSRIADLGMPAEATAMLGDLLEETSGAILVTGPAGSGKTTTVYACMRETVTASEHRRSVVTLEDPIEMAVEGAAQSQVNESAGYDLAMGLRSLMRQDPEVIVVGEIRDGATAEIAFQAAMTGQLLLTTFHSGSAAGAVSRLLEMGIKPYVLRSGLLAIVAQRLVRRLCDCSQVSDDTQPPDSEVKCLGLPVDRYAIPVGCDHCRGTGYRGRMLLVEILRPTDRQIAKSILERCDAQTIYEAATSCGMVPIWRRACEAVEARKTSPAEVRRVLGTFTIPTNP